MSYEVVVGGRSLGQFASNKGYADLASVAAVGAFPVCRAWFDAGTTKNVSGAVRELSAIACIHKGDVGATALALIDKIRGKAEAVITDGVS